MFPRSATLTRNDILRCLDAKRPLNRRLFISPFFLDEQLGDTSIDLRLGQRFLVSDPSSAGEIDLVDLRYEGRRILRNSYREVRVPFGGHFTLHPRSSVQIGSMEYLGIPNKLQGTVSLRKSVSDLLITANEALVHPGHKGIVTLTLTSNADVSIKLRPGMRIAQLRLHRLSQKIQQPKPSRYHTITGPAPSELYEDEDLEYIGPVSEPIIVGIAGTIAAGRTTAVSHLLERYGFAWFSLAAALKQEAIRTGIPTLRNRLQELGRDLRAIHGDSYLAVKLRTGRKWQANDSTLVLVDSFKNLAEVEEFRKQRRFTLLGIDAPREERWQRVQARHRQGDPTTYDEFREQDAVDRGLANVPHGQEVDKLLEVADRHFINDGTIPEFIEAIDRFVEDLLHPARRRE